VLALSLPVLPTNAAVAAESVLLPFEAGVAVHVVQGYNGGTHRDNSRFGLDPVLTGTSIDPPTA
jgi:hypothetical protein